jgi:hypothetical protein
MVNRLCYELRKLHSNDFQKHQESLVSAVCLPSAFFAVSTTFLFFLFDQERGVPPKAGLHATESLPKGRRERKGVNLILVFLTNTIHNSHQIFLSSVNCKIFLGLKRNLKEHLKKQD